MKEKLTFCGYVTCVRIRIQLKAWTLFRIQNNGYYLSLFVRPDLWVTLCDADTPVDASGKRIAKSVRQGARQFFFPVPHARVADPDPQESAFPS
jgi:hypothetical protein